MRDFSVILEGQFICYNREGKKLREKWKILHEMIPDVVYFFFQDGYLLGCCSTQYGTNLPTFQKCLLPSALDYTAQQSIRLKDCDFFKIAAVRT
jgi:hypothetical protein